MLTEKLMRPNRDELTFPERVQIEKTCFLLVFYIIKLLTLTMAVISVLLITSGCGRANEKIVIGSKNFTEQHILGNILVLLIERNTNFETEYTWEMSSNYIFESIQRGDVDLYIDYTGTIYGNYLGKSDKMASTEVFDLVKNRLMDEHGLLVLNQLGFNNTYTLSVRPETAAMYNLEAYSDLAEVASEFTLGASNEVLRRNDGIPNLKLVYDMSFKGEFPYEGPEKYKAITDDVVQVIDAFSTDGMLLEYDLVTLVDDKEFFPAYYAVPIINMKIAEKYPEIVKEVEKLENIFTDNVMRELNYKVDILKERPEVVAEKFLKSKGLIK